MLAAYTALEGGRGGEGNQHYQLSMSPGETTQYAESSAAISTSRVVPGTQRY